MADRGRRLRRRPRVRANRRSPSPWVTGSAGSNTTATSVATPGAVRAVEDGAGAVSIAVAIVSHDTREHLRLCLDSVLAETPDEVVVVDNASTDGTVAMLQERYPEVTLHANGTNRGYGAAANQAIASCRSGYVLLLNGDTTLDPGALGRLAAHMDRHADAVVVGPLLRRPDGSIERSYFQFPGTLGWLLENEPVSWLLPYLPVPRAPFLCLAPPTVDRVVPWVKGAALLLRRTAFQAVGGFDESYFMYFEEIDLCRRLRAAGGQIHFTPSATVGHVGGASTSQYRRQMRLAHYRSALHFYERHCSGLRRRFWIGTMKLKMLIRLGRDVGRRRRQSDPRVRAELAEQIDTWTTALRLPASPEPRRPSSAPAVEASPPRGHAPHLPPGPISEA